MVCSYGLISLPKTRCEFLLIISKFIEYQETFSSSKFIQYQETFSFEKKNVMFINLFLFMVARIEPKYQELQGKDIPKVEKDGVKATIIAGEALSIKSPVYT